MATELQKRALEKVVEIGRTKKRLIKGRVLKEVGYSANTAIAPDKVFQSKGFLELCDELGLTDSFLTKSLVADIKAKPENRKPELELGFKIRGRLKEDAPKGNQYNFFLNAEQLKRIAERVQNGNTASETESS